MKRLLIPGRAQALSLLFIAAFIWGGTFVVTKALLTQIGPFTIMTVRFLLAFLVLLPLAYRAGLRPRGMFERRIVAFALTGMFLHLGLEITGLRFTTASSAALVVAASPAVTGLVVFAMDKERLPGRQMAAMALSVVGAIVVTGATPAGGARALLGNGLVLAGVLAWAVYTLQGRNLAQSHSAAYTTAGALGVGALMSAPVAVAELITGGSVTLSAEGIAALIYLGVGGSALAFLAWNTAMAHVSPSTAAPFVNLVPVIGVSLGVLSGETLSPIHLIGGGLVAAGLWLSSSRTRSERRQSKLPLALPQEERTAA